VADVSAELVLGLLDRAEQEATLEHIHACDACAREVAALEHTAMALLEAVPEATPLVPLSIPGATPEQTAAAPARTAESPLRPRRRRGLGLLHRGLLAPALAATAAGLAAVVVLLAGGGQVQVPSSASAQLTLAGRKLGQVSLTTGRQIVVAISLRNAPGVHSVRCIVWQHSGRGAMIGSFAVSGGRATWSGQSPWPIATLRSVELVSAAGRRVAVAHIHA
jgi:anti-sigma factor RsiW